jgi:hypothetical protein
MPRSDARRCLPLTADFGATLMPHLFMVAAGLLVAGLLLAWRSFSQEGETIHGTLDNY